MNYAISSTKTGRSGPNFDIAALSFLQAQFCSMSLNDTAILINCAEPYGRTKSVDARRPARLRVRCLPSANTFGPHRWTMVRAQIWSLEPKPAATCWSHLLRASTAAIILHFLKDKADSLATHIFFDEESIENASVSCAAPLASSRMITDTDPIYSIHVLWLRQRRSKLRQSSVIAIQRNCHQCESPSLDKKKGCTRSSVTLQQCRDRNACETILLQISESHDQTGILLYQDRLKTYWI